MKKVKVTSPATIANITCGFDVLGLALNEPVDEMVIRKSNNPGVHITNILGTTLPKTNSKNIVGVVLEKILQNLPNNKYGIEVEIYKNIRPGSGIGSSAASAAGAAVGANYLFDRYFKTSDIIQFAIEGEKLAAGVGHADNVAPAILGGITLIRSYNPLDIISLPYPKKLWATVVKPTITLKTSESRKVLSPIIFMEDAIKQWGNVGALVSSFYREDYELISKSLEDFIVEPRRSIFIPVLKKLKIECKKVGALGGGISGSGPAVYMLSEGKEIADRVAGCMRYIYNKLNLSYRIYISTINYDGVKVY